MFVLCIYVSVYMCLLCIFIFMYIYIYMCVLPCIHQKNNDEDMASFVGMAQGKMVFKETQKHTVPSVMLVGVQQHLPSGELT